MNVVAVVDGTAGAGEAAARQARALVAFLRDGLAADALSSAGQTQSVVFFADDRHRQALLALAPTRAVRLVKVAARHEGMAAVLSAMARDGQSGLFLFAGQAGPEPVARLAARTGGSALTGVLSAEFGAERLLARKAVYSGHLVGRFALGAPPWALSLEPSWGEASGDPPAEHVMLSETDETTDAGLTSPTDAEFVPTPPADDMAASRFLVAAGQGAGSRARIERIAEAARRMGAGFGVSRPVAMNAWAPMDRLLGVSGARVAPEVCIVVGASGAPAFLWGVERSSFVVAINPDDRAPIAHAANVVIRDDGLAVLEALAAIVESETSGRE